MPDLGSIDLKVGDVVTSSDETREFVVCNVIQPTALKEGYFYIYSLKHHVELDGKYYRWHLVTGVLRRTGRTFDLDGLYEKQAEIRRIKREESDTIRQRANVAAERVWGAAPDASEKRLDGVKKLKDLAADPEMWDEKGNCKACGYVPKVSKFTPLRTQQIRHQRVHPKDDPVLEGEK